MSFISVTMADLTEEYDDFVTASAKVFFAPLPTLAISALPTIWLDLHLSDIWFEVCGEDNRETFQRDRNGLFVSIRPGRSVRFSTLEKIGLKNDVTAIIVNSAGMATKGLLVAPGKVDPGFQPNALTLVVSNLSKRSIDLRPKQKIASIAFARTPVQCAPTNSPGWAERRIDGYSASRLSKMKDHLRNIRWSTVMEKGVVPVIAALLALAIRECATK